MAKFEAIVINDGQDTPEAHTFHPATRNGNLITWEDRAPGVFAGFNRISLSSRPFAGRNGIYRVILKITAPKLAVTSPQGGSGVQPNPQAAYHTESNLEILLPAATDREARATALAYMVNVLSQQQIIDAVVDLNPPV